MLKLKLQYFGQLNQRANSLEKSLMLGNTEGKRKEQQRMRWLDNITYSMDVNLSKLQETVKDKLNGVSKVRHDLATEEQQTKTVFLGLTETHATFSLSPASHCSTTRIWPRATV